MTDEILTDVFVKSIHGLAVEVTGDAVLVDVLQWLTTEVSDDPIENDDWMAEEEWDGFRSRRLDRGWSFGMLLTDRGPEQRLRWRVHAIGPRVYAERCCCHTRVPCELFVLIDISDVPDRAALRGRIETAESHFRRVLSGS